MNYWYILVYNGRSNDLVSTPLSACGTRLSPRFTWKVLVLWVVSDPYRYVRVCIHICMYVCPLYCSTRRCSQQLLKILHKVVQIILVARIICKVTTHMETIHGLKTISTTYASNFTWN